MPQTSPMSWIILSNATLMVIMLTNSMLNTQSKTFSNNKLNVTTSKTILWKW